uniref:Uncharacterized protein n=1 Tax=viral metagenome TaxID=1070528 RepID=A0A6M3IJB0_9ZZZZ
MVILRITDPTKIVTDELLLKSLAEQGVDKDYVEFSQDYSPRSLGKGHSPYAKFYRDLNSNKRFMVVSGLPMVDADGVKIEAGWKVAGINYFSEKNNLFRVKVQGTQVEITVRNDQPDGRKAGSKLTFNPQLFLNGVEQIPEQSVLLPVNPLNPNYTNNTLEWDYGICKRRLRIIEGSILGSWVFASKPVGEVRIKYNQIGDYRLKLGQFKIGDDEEVVKPEDFDQLAQEQNGYPVIVMDSATFYPDAHIETTSVDGRLYDAGEDTTWQTLVAKPGDTAQDSTADAYGVYIASTSTGNQWAALIRSIFLFDTSGLDDGAIISAATLSIMSGDIGGAVPAGKKDLLSIIPDVNIYSSAPVANTSLAAGDFDSCGTTPFSTTITYANWAAGGTYNDFALNATGIAAISKTGVSKFSARNANYDVAEELDPGNHAPAWSSFTDSALAIFYAEKGNGYKPKLVVTYTVGWANIAKVSGVASASIAKMNGVAVAAIAKVSGVAV